MSRSRSKLSLASWSAVLSQKESLPSSTRAQTTLTSTKGFAAEWGLRTLERGIHREIHQVTTTGSIMSDLVTFELRPIDAPAGPSFHIGAFTVPNLVEGTPVPDWVNASNRYPYLKRTDPQFPEMEDTCVILLGGDYARLMSGPDQARGKSINKPLAELTPLGWAYTGRTGIMGLKDAGNNAIDHCSLVSYHAAQRVGRESTISSPEDRKRVRIQLDALPKSEVPLSFRRGLPPVINNARHL